MLLLKVRLHGNDLREIALEAGREYTFGRGELCDVVLEAKVGISRIHFKIHEVDTQWKLVVTSKFGYVTYGGQNVRELDLTEGTAFKLTEYDFYLARATIENPLSDEPAPDDNEEHSDLNEGEIEAVSEPIYDESAAEGESEILSENAPWNDVPTQDESNEIESYQEPIQTFGGNTDPTNILATDSAFGIIRYKNEFDQEQTIELHGTSWLAGRELGLTIQLTDPKSSRRQFKIKKENEVYTIRDLGSSNGTKVNEISLDKNEKRPLKSGDTITVGQTKLQFELRDPNIQKQLMLIEPEPMASAPALHPNLEIINYPVALGPGGAIKIDGPYVGGHGSNPYESEGQSPSESKSSQKAKKIRFYLVLVGVLIPLLGYLAQLKEPPPAKSKAESAPTDPAEKAYAALSPKNQQFVKELFAASRDLYIQGKLENAAGQLARLHEILPTGYKNSLAMAEECKDAAEQAALHARHLAELKQQEENRQKVEDVLRKCQPLAQTTMNEDEIRTCLNPVFDLDPANPVINLYIEQVQKRNQEYLLSQEQKKDYEERVSRGRALYLKAETLDKQDKPFDAIDAYNKHIESVYPDPGKLKSQSQSRILEISKNLRNKANEAIKAAEDAYGVRNYRLAIDQILLAKQSDPNNEKAAELNAKIRKELNTKMKELYEEAVIAEGIGNLDQAKVNWQKIVATDHPDGNYYKKAKHKLRLYGIFE